MLRSRLELVDDEAHFSARMKSLRRQTLRVYQEPRLKAYVEIRSRLVPLDFFRFAEATIPESGRVLDVGSGAGIFTLILAQLRPNAEFLGLELNPRRVAGANQTATQLGLTNVRFQVADVREPNFQNSFDAAIAIDLLHHLPRVASDQLVMAIHSCLRPGAAFLLKEIDVRPRWRWLFTYVLDLLMARRDHFSYFSIDSRIKQLRSAGFIRATGFRLASPLPYPHILVTGLKAA